MATKKMYTVGYEGRAINDFINMLKRVGIHQVVDVRELPLSRRKGFSKTKLNGALAAVGIEYVHLRAAGNPYREFRHDVQRCLKMYCGYIDDHPEVIDEVARLALAARTALLCVEADPTACHRSILAQRIQDSGAPVSVQHL